MRKSEWLAVALHRVREGEAPSVVIAAYGCCRTTIYKWFARGAGAR